jgi:molecular chaperone GrpE (heat shock protein)
MKNVKNAVLFCLIGLCLFAILGCGKKADESKPISEVKAEADKMDTKGLRAMAMEYKEAITAKKSEVDKLAAKIKEIPVGDMLGQEAKDLKADLENLEKSVTALQERFQVYYDKLKEKGGDLTGLEN